MTSERISFSRDGMIHPNYATYWENTSINNWVEEYTLKIVRAHHIAILFPTLDYRTVMAIVSGTKVLTAIDTEEFYGVEISDAE